MSLILDGKFIRSELARRANGGTEYMAETLADIVGVPDEFAIHVSRPVDRIPGKKNILYVHDLPEDTAYAGVNFLDYDAVVFVSAHQYARFASCYVLDPYRTRVIPNCIPTHLMKRKRVVAPDKPVRFIYHTTPHRGLEELVEQFPAIRSVYPKATLQVFSSFGVYGWEDNDNPYLELFDKIKSSPYMTYHGFADRVTVYQALNESDVFFYPSKWEETSCIALIEAARSGLLCVTPCFGALVETSRGYANCINYNSGSMPRYDVLFDTINNMVFRETDVVPAPDKNATPHHGLDAFKTSWRGLFKTI